MNRFRFPTCVKSPVVTHFQYSCRHFEVLNKLGRMLTDSMASFTSVSLLLLTFVIVVTILALWLFGDLELDIVNPNFHTFINSFISIFQVRKANLPQTMFDGNCAPSVHLPDQSSRINGCREGCLTSKFLTALWDTKMHFLWP